MVYEENRMNIVKNWYWKWDNVIPHNFCDLVLANCKWKSANQGSVSVSNNTYAVDENIRSTDVIWEGFMTPIGSVMQAYTSAANQQAEWNYDISSMEEVQIGKYDAKKEAYYDWHIDTEVPLTGKQRKLTAVILLNDPTEFEGGQLEIEHADKNNLLPSKGSIVVFPSFMRHRVTKVTKGVRYTAVAWVSGPAFR